MTDDARVREIAKIIAPEAFAVSPEMYGCETEADWRNTMGWAAQEVALDQARAIAALPPQPVMTEEERNFLAPMRERIRQAELSGYWVAGEKTTKRLLDIIDHLSAQPGNHQSSTSARDAALDDVRAMVCKEWHHVVEKFKLLPGTELENVFGTIISGIDAMKGGETWPEVTKEQADKIDKVIAPEFEGGEWETVESENGESS